MNLQLWAKNNTPHDSLFMTDPTHYYGWRDFSQRSSFGNLREWGYGAIVYNPNHATYKRGIKRLKEFGVNLDRISSRDIKTNILIPYARHFNKLTKNYYYSLSDKKLQDLSSKYDIEYFVMQKAFIRKKSKLPIVYENEHFILFAADVKS